MIIDLERPTRAQLFDSAERRWDAIREARPDFEPALDLQRRLLTVVIDVLGTVETGPLPRLSLPPKYLAAKLGRAVPVLAGEPIPVPAAALTPPLLQLCTELAAGGAGAAAEHIRTALETGALEAGSLLATSLARDQNTIRTGAVHRGLAPDLVWLVAELAVSPFVHALQRSLLSNPTGDAALAAGLDGWRHGHCPACGSWPALAEVVVGRRVLRCSFCASAWERTTYACVYCEHTGQGFVTAAPNQERVDRRVEVCSRCKGYLKTVDSPVLSPFPLVAIADMETMDLDVAAMEHGYARLNLKDFGTTKGTKSTK